jgi:uncharacterized protein
MSNEAHVSSRPESAPLSADAAERSRQDVSITAANATKAVAQGRLSGPEEFRQHEPPKDVIPSAARDLLFSSQRLGVRAALFALRFYKLYLSAFVGGSCRFQPTCSVYAYEAIERFGVTKGSWLALKRLLRCHPLSRKFGFDPVPEQEAHS